MTTLTDPASDVTIGGRRAEVLGRLRKADGPLSAPDIAALTGLHISTARFHLDGLVADGLAERSAEPRDLPGRPRILYSAGGQVLGPRSYGLLAEMLTGLVASLKDARPAAVDAGRAWGRHLVERPAPSDRVDADEAVTRLNRVLDAVGFQPEVRPVTGNGKDTGTSGDAEIWLHHCLFREVASGTPTWCARSTSG